MCLTYRKPLSTKCEPWDEQTDYRDNDSRGSSRYPESPCLVPGGLCMRMRAVPERMRVAPPAVPVDITIHAWAWVGSHWLISIFYLFPLLLPAGIKTRS